MSRILVNTASTLTRTFTIDGTPTEADGNVTISIVDAAGATVVAATNTTDDAAVGVYTYTLAPQTQVKRCVVTWTGTWSGVAMVFTDTLEVVGGHLFTETEARTYHDGQFADSVFTDTAISEARDRIADGFAEECGVSFVPRYERERLVGTGRSRVTVRWPKVTQVISATVGGIAVTAEPDPLLPALYLGAGNWSAGTQADRFNVIVEYRHGHEVVPADIKRAALIVLRFQLQPDVKGGGIPDSAQSMTDAFGNLNFLAAMDDSGSYYGSRFARDTLRHYRLKAAIG